MAEPETNCEAIRFTVRDGLTLHVSCYKSAGNGRRAVVCIPGLTRNSRDFDRLAKFLSSGPDGRDVYAIDLRGRGLSDHDRDWRNYVVPIEAMDVIDLITLRGLSEPIIIGTSRGGLIGMAMASIQPSAVGGVVLNDIGPVIEHSGMIRIAGYVGRMPLPANWPEAILQIKSANREQFPKLTDQDWEELARQWFNTKDDQPIPGYDGKLGRTMHYKDGKVPPLWGLFTAVRRVPVLVIRGANSDILSAQTVEDMCQRHPQCATITIADQGHAPLLKDPTSQGAIRKFLVAVDEGAAISGQSFD